MSGDECGCSPEECPGRVSQMSLSRSDRESGQTDGTAGKEESALCAHLRYQSVIVCNKAEVMNRQRKIQFYLNDLPFYLRVFSIYLLSSLAK